MKFTSFTVAIFFIRCVQSEGANESLSLQDSAVEAADGAACGCEGKFAISLKTGDSQVREEDLVDFVLLLLEIVEVSWQLESARPLIWYWELCML